MVPVVEERPFEESRESLEEDSPRAVAEPEGAVAFVEKLEGRVHEKGQHVHRGQEIGKVASPMPEVVFETISADLQVG